MAEAYQGEPGAVKVQERLSCEGGIKGCFGGEGTPTEYILLTSMPG
jgi:hypothetical protein